MAEFYWRQQVDQGCPFCGASVHERGFVDCIADTVVRNTEGEVTGVVDLFICASCAEQIARMVGSATQHETLELAQIVIDKDEENEKLKDEVQAWKQRFDNLVKALSEGIDASNFDLGVPKPVDTEPLLVGQSSESKTGQKGTRKRA